MPLIPLISYVFVMTFTPGPNNIMTMTNANHYGFKQTIKFMLGVMTGLIIILASSAYFNLLLLDIIPQLETYIGTIGGIYLTYLAVRILQNTNHTSGQKINLNSFKTGLLMQLVNPKAIIFGLSVMANFIIPYVDNKINLALIALFLGFYAFIPLTCWALFGVGFKKILSNHRKTFNISMSILLFYSALSIAGII